MPTYTFRDINTGDITEVILRMAEYDQYREDNPQLERYYTPDQTLNIVSGVGGIRTDQGFKEVLSKISEAHPRSALAEKTLSRSTKEVKTAQVLKKHGIL